MKTIVCLLFVLSSILAQTNESVLNEPGNEIGIVREILRESGVNYLKAEKVAKVENGKVVELDLSNRIDSLDGISKLSPKIGQLTSLRKLSISDNSIDSIPSEIGFCRDLVELNVGSNRIAELPVTIARLTKLEKLDARYNQLNSLPPSIDNCSNLRYLQLWGNRFVTLPSDIGLLTSLKELYLKNNRLTSLPNSITKLNLTYFDFFENKLCTVPPAIDTWLKTFDKQYKSSQKCW